VLHICELRYVVFDSLGTKDWH